MFVISTYAQIPFAELWIHFFSATYGLNSMNISSKSLFVQQISFGGPWLLTLWVDTTHADEDMSSIWIFEFQPISIPNRRIRNYKISKLALKERKHTHIQKVVRQEKLRLALLSCPDNQNPENYNKIENNLTLNFSPSLSISLTDIHRHTHIVTVPLFAKLQGWHHSYFWNSLQKMTSYDHYLDSRMTYVHL